MKPKHTQSRRVDLWQLTGARVDRIEFGLEHKSVISFLGRQATSGSVLRW